LPLADADFKKLLNDIMVEADKNMVIAELDKLKEELTPMLSGEHCGS
jgi:hypothetical protein